MVASSYSEAVTGRQRVTIAIGILTSDGIVIASDT